MAKANSSTTSTTNNVSYKDSFNTTNNNVQNWSDVNIGNVSNSGNVSIAMGGGSSSVSATGGTPWDVGGGAGGGFDIKTAVKWAGIALGALIIFTYVMRVIRKQK